MTPCKHGVSAGKFCAQCPKVTTPSTTFKPVYVYDRDQVIALNKIRSKQGLSMLTGRETYEYKNGGRTGRVLGADGQAL